MPRKPTFSEEEKEWISVHVAPKFEELARKTIHLEQGEEIKITKKTDGAGITVECDEKIIVGKPVTFVMFGSIPLPLKKMRKKNLEYHLTELGLDKRDIEELVDKYLWAQRHIRKFERGIRALLRDWAPWFRNEMSAEKIARITGRTKTTQIPLRVAAEITRGLIKKFYPTYAGYTDRIEDLMTPWWKNPPLKE